MNYLEKPWFRKSVVVVIVLVILSPVFAWAAGLVGYSEPLENAAEKTGALEEGYALFSGFFPNYQIPGLETTIASAIAGFFGVIITFGVAVLVSKALKNKNE